MQFSSLLPFSRLLLGSPGAHLKKVRGFPVVRQVNVFDEASLVAAIQVEAPKSVKKVTLTYFQMVKHYYTYACT